MTWSLRSLLCSSLSMLVSDICCLKHGAASQPRCLKWCEVPASEKLALLEGMMCSSFSACARLEMHLDLLLYLCCLVGLISVS